ncbi:MAG TPA: PKD domain-containing protein, partial [Chitinophagales bacterium]|nr:PKD domain-containing protein [Chitinophagales bacterium]
SIRIAEVAHVTADYEVSAVVAKENEPVSFINHSSGALRFEWHFGDGNISSEANPVHAYMLPGEYKVTLLAENDDCTGSKTCAITVLKNDNAFLGIDESNENNAVKIYGYESRVYIEFGEKISGSAVIDIFNVLGKRLVETNVPAVATHILESPPSESGCFFIRVLTEKGNFIRKVLLSH